MHFSLMFIVTKLLNVLVLHNAMNSSEELQLLNSLPLSQQCSPEEEGLIKAVYAVKLENIPS